MGRAGSGGSRGGGFSGGRSGSSRSSSGHRVSLGGSSHRAGSGGGSYRPSSGGGYRPPRHHSPPPTPPRHHGGYYGSRRTVVHHHHGPRDPVTDRISTILAAIVVLVILAVWVFNSGLGGSSQSVTMKGLGREKLNASIGWNSNCVIDEINYINNKGATATGLKEFYDITGMQPYAVFKAYDSSLSSDNAKAKYAEQWYEDNIDNEATILYMYFEDTDQSVPGYMHVVGGSQTKTLWDNLAQEKFWDFIDMYWAMDESVMSTDKLIIQSFVNTGKFITEKGTITTSESHGIVGFISKAMPVIIIGGVVIIVLIVVMRVRAQKREHEAAEAAETAAILNAPLDTSDPEVNDLVDKYSK